MAYPRIYLDTSVWSLFSPNGTTEYEKSTTELFDHVRLFNWELVSSEVVLGEIEGLSPSRREMIFDLFDEYAVEVWGAEDEIHALANDYLRYDVVTRNHWMDCLHVAAATVARCDFLLSWNFRHLANINKARKFVAVNEIRGYTKPIRICTPMEAYEV